MKEDNSKILEIFYLTWPNLPRTKKVESTKPNHSEDNTDNKLI